jgi:hypothetical protein
MSAKRSATRNQPSPGLLAVGVQGLDHLVGDVMFGIDIHRILQNKVIFFSHGDFLDDLVGTLNHQLQLLILAGIEVFLEFTALALELTILIDQLLLLASNVALQAWWEHPSRISRPST